MNRFTELRQRPDDSWVIEIPQDNGLMKAVLLPPLSKAQAIREAQRHTDKDIRCWDKTVLQAIADGKVDLKRSAIE